MTKSQRELAQAYKELCDELSRILYEEDPVGIGRSIGAPRDEYDEQAARLVTALRNATSRDQIEQCLHQMFQFASSELLERVDRAMTQFRLRTSS